MVVLTQLPEWQALMAHQKTLSPQCLSDLFIANPSRFQDFSFQYQSILFDFSKHYWTQETLSLLIALANARQLGDQINDLFQGKPCNRSENRAALHMALRHPEPHATDIAVMLAKMKTLVQQVRDGTWRGYRHEAITDVVHVGVGGSLLGPKLVVEALAQADEKLRVHFVGTLDGKEADRLLKKLNPATTLCVIASKTFTTQDTLNNAHIFRAWFTQNTATAEDFAKHFIGVSANAVGMTEFGIPETNQFLFWDFVGGRYSVWSAVGLVIALAIGMDKFSAFLQGAHRVDQHVQTEPFETNVPVLMGLLTIWYRNFWGCTSQAILPYDAYLAHLPAYLQQLDMESCGKGVTQTGESIDYQTGAVIWGDVGSNGEHAFFQLLHQGTDMIPVDFIVPVQTTHQHACHDTVLAHALGQARALMVGQMDNTIPPHRRYLGNKPSSMIVFEQLTPAVLGALLACYEHKVFVQSTIWGINPFDQWGVELGKTLSKELLATLQGRGHAIALDASTHGLLTFMQRFVSSK